MCLSFVIEPERFPLPSDLKRGMHLDTHQLFVDAIANHARAEIPRIEGFLRDVAPADGFILFAGSAEVSLKECSAERRATLLSRMVLLGGLPSRACQWLESFSMPAAVSEIGSWLTDSRLPLEERSRGAHGLYGIRDVGARIGALDGPGPRLYHSSRYSYLSSPTHDGLPHLLVDYLTLYQEIAATGVDPRTLATIVPPT